MLNEDRFNNVIKIKEIFYDRNYEGIFILMEDYNANQLLSNYIKQKQEY